MCQSLNVPVSKSDKPQYVHLMDQSTADIIGSLEIPIQLQGRTHLITSFILPTLCVDVTVGLYSLYRLGLVLNPADRTWYYQSRPEELFQFADNETVDRSIARRDSAVDTVACLTDNELSNHQRAKLGTFLNTELPLSDKVSGRTSLIQHTIETGDAEPVKQRYYPVTPVIQQAINMEILKESHDLPTAGHLGITKTFLYIVQA
jgi:hypothetical protein